MKKSNLKKIVCSIITLLLVSCSILETETISEKEYIKRKTGEDPLTVTLTCDIESINYEDQLIYITAEFNNKVNYGALSEYDIREYGCDIESIERISNSVEGGSKYLITLDPSSYSYRTDDITVYISSESVVDENGQENLDSSNTITITKDLFDFVDIYDMSWSSSNNKVYALSRDDSWNYELLELDLINKNISNRVTLTKDNATTMDYSEIDNKLYIIQSHYTVVEVVDLNSLTSTIIDPGTYSYSDYGTDIKVDPINRRIYLLVGRDTLYCIDMDSHITIYNTYLNDSSSSRIYGKSLGLDKTNKKLYVNQNSSSDSKIYRFNIANDTLVLEEESNPITESLSSLSINPEKTVITLAPNSYNNHYLYAYDTSNLNNTLNYWDVGDYPNMSFFNPTKNLLYASNEDEYDENLYIMSTTNYSLVKKLPLPDSEENVIFTTNKDGTKGVAYTEGSAQGYYSTYTKKRLHFFDSIE